MTGNFNNYNYKAGLHMNYEIVDFHTHPFFLAEENICAHKEYTEMSPDSFLDDMKELGITCFAGSVITRRGKGAEMMKNCNESAFKLREIYGKKYIPGIQIDPNYVNESISEIDAMIKRGFKLIGELVPYHYGWDYSHEGLYEILDYTKDKHLIYSFHTMDHVQMEALAQRYKDTTFVFAHPGEKPALLKQIELMKRCENVYLDLSGTGLFRYGMLKRLVCEVGAERILFGSDYPVCNPGMYVGGVMLEKITEKEKKLIFAENAKRLLSIN